MGRMAIKPFGMQETEHTAGFPMTGHYRQTTVAFTFLALFGQPCGGECRFSCFSSPVADNIPQCPDNEITKSRSMNNSLAFIVFLFE